MVDFGGHGLPGSFWQDQELGAVDGARREAQGGVVRVLRGGGVPTEGVPIQARPGGIGATGGAATTLRIIHVNDVYQLKNFPKLQTLVKEQSAGYKNVLITLAGDFIAPSLLSALDQGAGMIELMNAVGVTHECTFTVFSPVALSFS